MVKALTVVGRLTVTPQFAVDLTIYMDGDLCDPFQLKEYCPGQTMKANSSLENTGTENITGNLSMVVKYKSENITPLKNWYNINLSVNEIDRSYQINYTIKDEDEEGKGYYVESNFTYDGNFTTSSCEFRVNKGIGTLTVSPSKINMTIPPGGSDSDILEIWLEHECENTTVFMNASSGEPGDWVSFNPKEFLLLPDKTEKVEVRVNVPSDADPGLREGVISVSADNQSVDIDLFVNVSIKYFFLNVTVPPEKKEICPGENIYAEVNITKIRPSHPVDVNMTYRISNEEILDEKNETLYNITNETIVVPVLTVPSSTAEGTYDFEAILEYNETRIKESDTFKVVPCPKPPSEVGRAPSAPAPPVFPSEFELTLNLSTGLLSVIAGNRTSFIAMVKNTGTKTVESVRISVEGIPKEWLDFIPEKIDIPSRGSQGFLVIINVPSNAKTGVYELRVKATDDIESNVETLTLIVGKNMKEIADFLLRELERARTEAERSLLVEECMDVTVIKTFHDDAALAFKEGKKEYQKGNYGKAISWFEYATPIEKKVVDRVDISLKMEIETSKKSKLLMPPFYEPEEKFQLANVYLDQKNYEEICGPIEDLREFIIIGLVFWPLIVIIVIVLILTIIILYRKKRGRERARLVEEVKERLGFSRTD